MIAIGAEYLFYLVTCSLLFVTLGRVLVRFVTGPVTDDSHTRLFIYYLTGVVAFVILYAMTVTGFQTVNICLIPLASWVVWQRREKPGKGGFSFKRKAFLATAGRSFPVVLLFIFYLSVFFFWEAHFLLKTGEFPFTISFNNHIFYSKLSEYLPVTGEENYFLHGSFYDDGFKGAVPYHYFEIWLNSGISRITGLLHINALMLITFPMFFTMIVFGYHSILNQLFRNSSVVGGKSINILVAAIPLLLLFFSGFAPGWLIQNPYFKFWYAVSGNPIMEAFQKMAPVYAFSIAALIALLKYKPQLALVMVLALPVIAITTAPGIFAGLCLLMMILFIMRKISLARFAKNMVAILVSAVGLCGFYLLFGSEMSFQSMGWNNLQSILLNDDSYIRDAVYFIKIIPFEQIIIFLPWIMLIFLPWIMLKPKTSSSLKLFFLFSINVYIASLLFWALFHFLGYDSIQFFYNIAPVLLNLSLICCLLVMIIEVIRRKYLYGLGHLTLAVIMLLLLIPQTYRINSLEVTGTSFNRYDDGYLREIEAINNDHGNPPKVFIRPAQLFTHAAMKNPLSRSFGDYFSYFQGRDVIIALDAFDIPVDDHAGKYEDARLLRSTLFYRYVMEQKANGTFGSIAQSQLDMINRSGARFLIYRPGSNISPMLENRIAWKITDPVSEEVFCVLSE